MPPDVGRGVCWRGGELWTPPLVDGGQGTCYLCGKVICQSAVMAYAVGNFPSMVYAVGNLPSIVYAVGNFPSYLIVWFLSLIHI